MSWPQQQQYETLDFLLVAHCNVGLFAAGRLQVEPAPALLALVLVHGGQDGGQGAAGRQVVEHVHGQPGVRGSLCALAQGILLRKWLF